jgi:hypothetical protein
MEAEEAEALRRTQVTEVEEAVEHLRSRILREVVAVEAAAAEVVH